MIKSKDTITDKMKFLNDSVLKILSTNAAYFIIPLLMLFCFPKLYQLIHQLIINNLKVYVIAFIQYFTPLYFNIFLAICLIVSLSIWVISYFSHKPYYIILFFNLLFIMVCASLIITSLPSTELISLIMIFISICAICYFGLLFSVLSIVDNKKYTLYKILNVSCYIAAVLASYEILYNTVNILAISDSEHQGTIQSLAKIIMSDRGYIGIILTSYLYIIIMTQICKEVKTIENENLNNSNQNK